MITCECGAVWSGKAEHCMAKGCHQTFSSTPIGDRHRVGLHGVREGKNRRRCLTPEEMESKRTKGQNPVFQSKANKYGCLVWSQWGENPYSLPERQESDGLDALPGIPGRSAA